MDEKITPHDLFAAAALQAIIARDPGKIDCAYTVETAWGVANLMMAEKARRNADKPAEGEGK
jgi:hypothetical protein